MRRSWFLLLLVGCIPSGAPTTVPSEPGSVSEPATSPEPEPEPPPAEPLRVGSWNVKRLGHGDKDLDAVAAIMDDFDVLAMQEVMTREVVEELDAQLERHEALLTDTPTPAQGSYREYFAFFYRPDRLLPTLNTYVADEEDRFHRDPYLACFEVLATGDSLCLLTVHVTYGDRVAERKAEIAALDDALRWAQDGDQTSYWVVLGDCNRPVDDGDADTDPEEEWLELLDRRRLRVPVVLAGPELPTTLGKDGYANSYDHIFVSTPLQERVTEAGRFDLVSRACEGSFELCRRRVSDHAPVFVDLQLGP